MIAHHPPLDLLVEHASGTLAEGPALAVAAHLAMCGHCRATAGRLDAVGGALLDSLQGEALTDGALERCLAGLDAAPAKADVAMATEPPAQVGAVLPFPLRAYVDRSARWRRSWGVDEMPLALPSTQHRAHLLRIRPGRSMPLHSHSGAELTLVLAGGFTDAGRHYGPGDLALAPSGNHAPAADPDGDCICLIVQEAPIVLVGAIGRWLNPVLRWRDRRWRRGKLASGR